MSALRVLSQAATWMRKISRSNTRIPSSFENQLFSIKLPFTKRKKDNIINGRLLAKDIQFNLQKKLSSFTEQTPLISMKPRLGYVLVGSNKDSSLYVRLKKKACEEIGIDHIGKVLHNNSTQEEVEKIVRDLYEDEGINGILVQLPLPGHLNPHKICDIIGADKDVDGLNPINVAGLVTKGRNPIFTPCTPKGCLYIMEKYLPSIKGKRAVVVGDSVQVGGPMSFLLQKKGATVTLCNIDTQNLPSIIRDADILVAAIGDPFFIKGSWIKPGALVLDVGINFIPDLKRKSGRRVVGDIDFQSAKSVAGWITPVPGGIGPMTVAMLMNNVVESWIRMNFPHTLKQSEELNYYGREDSGSEEGTEEERRRIPEEIVI